MTLDMKFCVLLYTVPHSFELNIEDNAQADRIEPPCLTGVCDRSDEQRCSKESVKELCQEGHEGYGYKRGNDRFAWWHFTRVNSTTCGLVTIMLLSIHGQWS